jgi:hypothetical protein
VTQVRVIRSEWAKLRAPRSTWWCALITVVLIVGLGAAITGSGTPAGKLFGGHQLSPWTGFAVLCGYAVALTVLAAWRLRRRDA